MNFVRLKETFLQLPKHIKFIGVGGLILGISTFLPWYADLDAYKIGDQFLGITGPASFVGVVILVLCGLSFWIFSYHVLERRMPRLPVREAIVHLFVSLESLFLLLLVNSIFFHSKFGVNITLKESRFGMTLAFIGAITLLIGGYLQNREEIEKKRDIGRLEPLIKMEPSQMSHSAAAQAQPIDKTDLPKSYERPHAPLKTSQPAKGFMFGEREPDVKKVLEEKEEKGGGSYMIRTDL